MEFIVDMQGFKQPNNDYILKELAIIPLHDNEEPLIFLFKEPYPWHRLTDKYKKENLWLEYFYHGIPWKSGERAYTEIGNIIREALRGAKRIFTIGSIQKKWLERFKFNVVDVTETNCPPLDKIKIVTICPHHNGAYKTNCALRNVRVLKKVLQKFIKHDNKL